jgi:CBS domain containing-hemolysin-like protein
MMIYFYLAGCLFFMLLQGFFAAIEISVISASLLKLQHRQNTGDKKAARVYQLRMQPERFLATTLVGINLSLILSSGFLTLSLIHVGLHRSNFWATILFTPLVVIFGELIPKNVGRHFKEDFSCIVVNAFIFFEKLFSPIVNIIEGISKSLIDIFIGKVKKRSLFVTKEEFRYLIKEVEEQGGIDKGEKEAIEEVFELSNKKIKDFCTKINNVDTLEYADSQEKVLAIAKQHNLTRYPVFSAKGESASGGKNKEIIGYVNIYDLFYEPHKNWQLFVRPLTEVDVNQRLYEIFTALKTKKENIALVLKGKEVYGIVTLQDLIKEIVASIIKI